MVKGRGGEGPAVLTVRVGEPGPFSRPAFEARSQSKSTAGTNDRIGFGKPEIPMEIAD